MGGVNIAWLKNISNFLFRIDRKARNTPKQETKEHLFPEHQCAYNCYYKLVNDFNLKKRVYIKQEDAESHER